MIRRRWAVKWDNGEIYSRHWSLNRAIEKQEQINRVARQSGFRSRAHVVDVRSPG